MYLCDLPDGHFVKVVEGAILSAMSWSPDGDALAFHRSDRDTKGGQRYHAVCIMDTKTRQTRQITPHSRGLAGIGLYDRDDAPVWYPNGKHLFFVANLEQEEQLTPRGFALTSYIYRVGIGGNDLKRLHPGFAPRIHPNGQWLYFVKQGVRRLNINSGEVLAIHESDIPPRVSPPGRWIAIPGRKTGPDGSRYGIWVLETAGQIKTWLDLDAEVRGESKLLIDTSLNWVRTPPEFTGSEDLGAADRREDGTLREGGNQPQR